MDRTDFIKEQILAGKDKETVRRELISQGESTLDLDAVYASLVDELGVEVPQAPAMKNYDPINVSYAAAPSVPFPTLVHCLRYGFKQGGVHLKEVLLASVCFFTPVVLFSVVPLWWTPVLIGVSLFSLFLFCIGGSVLAYAFASSSEKADPLLSLQWAVHQWGSLLWLCVVSTLVLIGSFVALIVPFVFVSLYIVFAIPVLVKENENGIRGLLRSYDLVRGKFFILAGYMLVLSIIGLFFSALASVLLLIPIPYVGLFVSIFLQALFTGASLSVITLLYTARAQERTLFDLSGYRKMKWMYRSFALIGFAAALVFAWSALGSLQHSITEFISKNTPLQGAGDLEEKVEVRLQDGVIQAKVVTTAASAKVYFGRLGFYDGVCKDISVVAPVQCKDSSDFFMIYAPLSETAFYCADSYGFSGEVERPKEHKCQ